MNKSGIGIAFASLFVLIVWSDHVRADVLVQEPGANFLAFEAEQYDSIEGSESTTFLEVEKNGDLETAFGSRVLPADSNVSGTALYDQPGDGNFTDLVTWKLQFSEPGTYIYYMRYTMFESQTDTDYGNEDSFYMPLEIGDLPEQDGWFGLGDQGHNDPYEDPPYWEGQFYWGGPYDYSVGGPIEYEVTGADVGSVLDFTISTRERGATLDAVVLSTEDGLLPEELDELLAEANGGNGGGCAPAAGGRCGSGSGL